MNKINPFNKEVGAIALDNFGFPEDNVPMKHIIRWVKGLSPFALTNKSMADVMNDWLVTKTTTEELEGILYVLTNIYANHGEMIDTIYYNHLTLQHELHKVMTRIKCTNHDGDESIKEAVTSTRKATTEMLQAVEASSIAVGLTTDIPAYARTLWFVQLAMIIVGDSVNDEDTESPSIYDTRHIVTGGDEYPLG